LAAAFAHLASQHFVRQQLINPLRESRAVHPRHQKTIFAVVQPFANSTDIEGDYRQAITHRVRTDHAEGFRPDRADRRDAATAIIMREFMRQDETGETNALGKS
jgi:hypothetical protein